jgi:uncharacterized protein YkwD
MADASCMVLATCSARIARPTGRVRSLLLTSAVGGAVVVATVAGSIGALGADGPANNREYVLSEVVRLVNDDRTAAGLPALTVDPVLGATAQTWAEQLADAGQLSHDPNLTSVPTRWRKLGENVGYGPEPVIIQEAFRASPSHAANVFDHEAQHIGVGVAFADDRIYVVQRFEDLHDTTNATARRPRVRALRN